MTVKRNAALGFIFITILIDVIGMGIIIPVVPKLLEEMTHTGISEAARYGGWLMFSYAIMQFIFSPIIGALSDRYGRRPVLLFSLLGLGIDYVFMAFAPSLFWLFIGRIIAGIAGASFTTAMAYIADISSPEKRAQNFGMVGAAFGLGFIIGPVLGGLAAQWSSRLPFILAAVLTGINLVYGYFILPESLLKENRRSFQWSRANPIGALAHLKKYPVISGLVACFTFIYLASHAVQSNWTYYTMLKFNWNEAWVGYSLGFVGLLVGTVQGGLIRVIIPKLGENKSVYVGLALYSIGMIMFAFATEGWMMFAFLVPYALGGICGPALQGIISRQVPDNEQGELQGALTSVISATSIVGPLMMNNLFAYATKPNGSFYFPGAPFILGSILCALSLFFAYKTLSRKESVA